MFHTGVLKSSFIDSNATDLPSYPLHLPRVQSNVISSPYYSNEDEKLRATARGRIWTWAQTFRYFTSNSRVQLGFNTFHNRHIGIAENREPRTKSRSSLIKFFMIHIFSLL